MVGFELIGSRNGWAERKDVAKMNIVGRHGACQPAQILSYLVLAGFNWIGSGWVELENLQR